MRFTSTSLTILARRAGAALRPTISKAYRLRIRVQQALHPYSTTSLTPPSLPHFHNAGHLPRKFLKPTPSRAYQPYNGAFRQAAYRPAARTPRGAAVPANVGLGSARSFSSAPTMGAYSSGAAGAGNVPVVLRAFAHVFDDDDQLPRGTRYVPYVRPSRKIARQSGAGPRARRLRRVDNSQKESQTAALIKNKNKKARTLSTVSSSSDESRSLIQEIGHYFPLLPSLVDADADEVVLPPLPDQLLTRGVSTTLALPLSPSLHALLSPTPMIGYATAEIGVSILAGLTQGLMPLHEAYSTYGNTRVIPLLARLDALGLLDMHEAYPARLEVVVDNGAPDMLRVIFNHRSSSDVYALLGPELSEDGGEWWTVTERKVSPLSRDERREIMEEWRDVERPANVQKQAKANGQPKDDEMVELIMPVLEHSVIQPPPPPAVSPATSLIEFNEFTDWNRDTSAPISASASPPFSPVSPRTHSPSVRTGASSPDIVDLLSSSSWTSSAVSSGRSSPDMASVYISYVSDSGSEYAYTNAPSEYSDHDHDHDHDHHYDYDMSAYPPSAPLTASLLNTLAARLRERDMDTDTWSVPPSDEDEAVEASVWLGEVQAREAIQEEDKEYEWVGPGFGLMQPW